MIEKRNFQDFQDFAQREISFAKEHVDDDTARLLLSASRYPDINMPAAVQQIEGLRVARDKWPSLLACDAYRYPPRLNREQASSEAVAARRVEECLDDLSLDGMHVADPAVLHVADLTGGMGIDTLAFAQRVAQVTYVERDAELCALMERNCKALGMDNVAVVCADSMEWLSHSGQHYDVIFVDPARRDSHGRKMVGFESCEPNILEHMPLLCQACRYLVVKASPMIDIDLGCRQLRSVSNVFVLVCGGECKEVCFMCNNGSEEETVIHSIVVDGDENQYFCITRKEESEAELVIAERMGRYLYEPNPAVMKAGAFAMMCEAFPVVSLARNSHLYTSDERVGDFPGRVWEVVAEVKPNRKDILAAVPGGRAHVVTRNYPVDAATLQRQMGLKEGGDLFVVATTVGSRRTAFLCKM